ncbi:MAG: PIN domain-containing protein [Candidatus Kerfeldbacteria bacterium]|nr:PIN domain-containing protein [Candidatus Kerfeldbacteria bacterium]
MKSALLDTNVLVRFLVADHAEHHKQAEKWFHEAEQGTRSIVVTSLVIAETTFVLESFYKLQRSNIARTLEVFVSQRWLKVEERSVLRTLWAPYRAGLHFVDSYLLARAALSNETILTFDKKLENFSS